MPRSKTVPAASRAGATAAGGPATADNPKLQPSGPQAPPPAIVAVGWDQSILHAGVVALGQDGRVVGQWCLTDKAGEAAQFGPDATRLPTRYKPKAGVDAHLLEVRRLVWLRQWTRSMVAAVVQRAGPAGVVVAVEDYAYGAARGAHQMGEAQGVLRCELMQHEQVMLRLCDVASVKMFATGAGNADKDAVRAAMVATLPEEPHWQDCKTVREDMADALALARMAWAEVQVRAGLLALSDLSQGERRVFLRTTPQYPVNLLERPYATKEPGQQ